MSDSGFIGIESAMAASGSDRTADLKFWSDVSRMRPRRWWSPASQWRDFWLRQYARRKLYQLRKIGANRG